METWARLLSILWLIGGVSGFQWSGSDSGPIQVCSGHSIELLWNFTLDRGERVKHTVWRYQVEGGSEDTLATCRDGHFVPMSNFSGRLALHKDGGIELSCATILESGNYSVIVSVEQRDSSQTRYSKTTTVKVVDTPKTQSGEIHVTTKAEAVRDVTTGAWHVHLACGNFSDLGHPPVDVIWTTPRGEQLESSGYEDGVFFLVLANPVLEGNYSCRIVPALPAAHCLPPHSPLRNTEVVQVEAAAARITVMDAQQRELVDTIVQMKDTMAAQRRETKDTIVQMKDTMAAERREMKDTIVQMRDTMAAQRREMKDTIVQMKDTMAQMNNTMAAERREIKNTMLVDTIVQMNNTMAAERREMKKAMAAERRKMKKAMAAEKRKKKNAMAADRRQMNNTMAEMNNTMAEMNNTMAEMNNTMAAERRKMKNAMAEMNNIMAEMNNTMAEMNNTIVQMNNTMAAERREMNNTMAAERRELMDTMAQMNNTMAEMNNTMAEMNNTIVQMNNTMAAERRELMDTMAQMNNTIADLMDIMEVQQQEMNNTMVQMNNTTAAERREMNNTKADLMDTMAEINNTMAQMNNTMAQMNNTMAVERREMDKRISLLEKSPGQIHRDSRPVSFYAILGNSTRLPLGSTLKLTRIITNHGGGYNSTTGEFTAPVNGTFFFTGTAGPGFRGQQAYMRLVKEGVIISYAHISTLGNIYRSPGSCHGVVDVEAGQRVWLEGDGNSYFTGFDTSFSGFRID